MLPDGRVYRKLPVGTGLNAPTGAWCSLTGTCATHWEAAMRLNAPTGAWCSLTMTQIELYMTLRESQCTYRCVVLPDQAGLTQFGCSASVSMHLQVRGAP